MSRVILYQEVRESCSLYVHAYIFCAVVSEDVSFTHSLIECSSFFNRSIWPIDETQVVLLWVRVNLGVIADLEPNHQIQFSVTHLTPHLGGVLTLCQGYSQHILSSSDKVGKFLYLLIHTYLTNSDFFICCSHFIIFLQFWYCYLYFGYKAPSDNQNHK